MKKEDIETISGKLDNGKLLKDLLDIFAKHGVEGVEISGIKLKEAGFMENMAAKCKEGKWVHVPGHGFILKCIKP